MTPISEVIRTRYSCRSYADTPVDLPVLKALESAISSNGAGPFGHLPRFALLSPEALSRDEWKKLGTYGVIKNARLFLAGVIRPAPMAACDFGYCMEKLILEATQLRLGTCWLGGTFSIGAFADTMGLRAGETLPAVTPVGYPADRKSLTERAMRRFAGSDHRKPWRELFFRDNLSTPLLADEAGAYAEALENVRLAPSASNKQPWRIVYDKNRQVFSFYIARAFAYRQLREVSLQDIDMGIAMCHFDLTVTQRGFKGLWRKEDSAETFKSLEYAASWQVDG
ncbi:MAG: nitroreductase family protein [Smithellaceae bacterium]